MGTGGRRSAVERDTASPALDYPAQVLGPVQPNGDVVACTGSTTIGNVRDEGVQAILGGEPFAENARTGRRCAVGCRDWGIYDLSALYEGRFGLDDAGRCARAFGNRAHDRRTS